MHSIQQQFLFIRSVSGRHLHHPLNLLRLWETLTLLTEPTHPALLAGAGVGSLADPSVLTGHPAHGCGRGKYKRQGWGYTLLTLHSVFTERWRKLVTSGLSTKQKQNKHAASFSSVNNRALKRKNTPHQMLSRLTLTQPYSDMNNSLVGVWISLFFVTD